MKIAIVTRVYSMHWGGAERVTMMISHQLADAGHEVHIYCSKLDGTPGKNIKVHLVPFIKFFSPLKILSFHRHINSALKEESFDIVYGHSPFFPLDTYYAGGGVHMHWMRIRYPFCLTRWVKYLISPVHLAMGWIEKNIYKRENHKYIVTNSLLVKRHIMDCFSVSEDRIRVIYDGLDHSVFNRDIKKHRTVTRENLGISEDDIVILFISNNWRRKGLDTILKSLSVLPDSFKLVVAGRGTPSRFAGEIKRLGIRSERIVFAGVTTEIEKFYGMSDIFVLPTMYDPFANVCREAMASGLPVITTYSNGAAEIITHGENGYILESWNDHKGLTKLLLALEDSHTREQIGLKAFDTAQQFTWEKNMNEHEALFNEIDNL